MSDIDNTAPARPTGPLLAEPEEDEQGDEMVFVRNGFIRCTIAGVLYKLRRPFLGEIKQLEATMEAAAEDLKQMGEQFKEEEEAERELAKRLEAEANDPETTAERRVVLDGEWSSLALKLNERLTRVQNLSRDLRERWWQQAFEMLTPPGHPQPPSMPGWVADAVLQRQVMEHWQSSPLARGSG